MSERHFAVILMSTKSQFSEDYQALEAGALLFWRLRRSLVTLPGAHGQLSYSLVLMPVGGPSEIVDGSNYSICSHIIVIEARRPYYYVNFSFWQQEFK